MEQETTRVHVTEQQHAPPPPPPPRQHTITLPRAGNVHGIIGFALVAAALIGGWVSDAGMAAFLGGMVVFAAQTVVIVALMLTIEYLVKLVTSSQAFDSLGAAIEMGKIRDRVGTPDEQGGDSVAVALQLLAVWLWRGLFALAYLAFYTGH